MKNYQKSRFKTLCAVVVVGNSGCFNSSALACAVLTEDFSPVRVADESALIIWDEKTKTEHFIRRATFDTEAKSIGFLVPTPGQPQLGEAEDEIFYQLEEKLRPRVIHQNVRDYYPDLMLFYFFGRRVQTVFNTAQNALNTSIDGVDVISEQRVGGFDTAVLRANDVGSLQVWLKKNGYVSGPTFDTWLQPYVQKGWFITAFKYTKTASSPQISSDAIRMSFKTQKPFFPYREPQGQGSAQKSEYSNGRLLRVFLLASQRMSGQLKDKENSAGWEHQVPFAKPFKNEDKMQLDGYAPKIAPFAQAGWLTVFEDRATVRANAGDLFWDISSDQSEAEPPPIIKKHYVPTPVPVEPFLLLFVGIGWMLWKRRES